MTLPSKQHSEASQRQNRLLLGVLILTCFDVCPAGETTLESDGHIKARLIAQAFPGDSVFHDLAGSESIDTEADLRLNLDLQRGSWSFNASYQLFGLYGDRVDYLRGLQQGQSPFFVRFPEDDRRLLDLTEVLTDDDEFAALHRLDRLWVGHTTDKTVLRLGRQAISWGNGLVFSPMDIVNPFDPTAIDTEYKAGDDMLYAQLLRDNGDDMQAAMVFRREPLSGESETDEGTVAFKYHGVREKSEYDVLVAVNHDDTTIGIGGNRSIGGAVLRSDIVVTDTESDTEIQLVANLSYSWTWGGKNVSGGLEYYFNGFGQDDDEYDLQSLGTNPDLLDRLARGELYTIGRHYLVGSLMIEVTPLWLLTPNLFLNAEDGSALLQLVTQNNLDDNLAFLGSLNIPIGPSGSEYGGIRSGTDRFLSSDLSVFAQVAWYF